MHIDKRDGGVSLGAMRLLPGVPLRELRASNEGRFLHPLVSNGEWETFQEQGDGAAIHTLFCKGRLWQVRISLILPEGESQWTSDAAEQRRHSLHQRVVADWLKASVPFVAENGARVSVEWDMRSQCSTIVISYGEVVDAGACGGE